MTARGLQAGPDVQGRHGGGGGGRIGRLAFLLPILLLAGCARTSVLNPAGPIASGERVILLDSLGIMLAIIIPTIIGSLGVAWWFRAGNKRASYMPDFVYSGRVELLVWSIPVLVVLFLAGVTWISSHDLDPARPIPSRVKPVEVQVVSLDWKWLFIYPGQGIATVNQLVVPVGVPVHFTLTSASVMNSFFIPQLGGMIYTMNGMVTQLNLRADHPGTYFGESAHYSGDGFSDMEFATRAVSPAQFVAWAGATRGHGPALDAAAYGQLMQQSQNVKPYSYGAVAPNLFRAIALKHFPAAPGPDEGRPGPQVKPVSES